MDHQGEKKGIVPRNSWYPKALVPHPNAMPLSLFPVYSSGSSRPGRELGGYRFLTFLTGPYQSLYEKKKVIDDKVFQNGCSVAVSQAKCEPDLSRLTFLTAESENDSHL